MKIDNIMQFIIMIFLTQSFIFLSVFTGLSISVWEEKQDRFEPWLYYYIEFGFIGAIPMLAASIIYLTVKYIPNKKQKVES